MSHLPNSMGADWCAARRAEAEAWVNTAPQGPARTHVIELLNQVARLPAGHVFSGSDALRLADMRADLADAAVAEVLQENAALLARAATLEAEAAQLRQELGEQEREKLALVQELLPLPFPANEPPSSYEQYFCQAGDDVCLLMWLSAWDAAEEVGTETGTWAEWDGDTYTATAHAVAAFWRHPQATPQPELPGGGAVGVIQVVGAFGGLCNRSACRRAGADWYNHSTRAYYCAECAGLINYPGGRVDAMRLFGHDVCTQGEHKA